MRGFEYARKMENGKPVESTEVDKVVAFPKAKLPEYATKHSAGADFFCAEEVVIPSIVELFVRSAKHFITNGTLSELSKGLAVKPILVHTGVKAYMEEDEALMLYNRSGNPTKLGLVLANGVGVVDADYYNNPDNDGEIMFAFYNFMPWSVTLKVGDKLGQGVFQKFLRPTTGLNVKEEERVGGFGSTGE